MPRDTIEYLDRKAWIKAIYYVFSSRWQHVVCDIARVSSWRYHRAADRDFMESRWFQGLCFFTATSSLAIRPCSHYICTYVSYIYTYSQSDNRNVSLGSLLPLVKPLAQEEQRGRNDGSEGWVYTVFVLTAAFITAVINGNLQACFEINASERFACTRRVPVTTT